MKNFIYNISYFLKEAGTMIRMSPLSNLLSLFCTGLIFFILAMVFSGWWISSEVIAAIQGEAEINVYFDENIGADGTGKLLENIKAMEGVREARVVGKDEAYDRMVEILGTEARVLEYFDDNPFSAFIEVKINLDKMEPVLKGLEHMPGIEHVRDNKEVLEKLRSISGVLKLLGYLVAAAVGISTLVIISHIIRLGIHSNREQINTLRLLGAPEAFIALPFLLEGLLLTLGGGILSVLLSSFTLKYIYGQTAGPLPFLPLPPLQTMVTNTAVLLLSLSILLGIVGSLFGLSSAKNK